VVGASGLSDDNDGKNDGLKEYIEGFGSIQIMALDEGGPKSNR
jgi:hypothetical protein